MKKSIVLSIMVGIMIIFFNNFAFNNVVIAAHTHSYSSQYINKGGSGHIIQQKCSCGRVSSSSGVLSHSMGSWSQTQSPTCYQQGIERRYCSRCGYGESRSTGFSSHSMSGWYSDKSSHWKVCNNCGSVGSSGGHYDNNVNGYCDACNYLMAIPAAATISGAVSVKVEGSATFKISVTKGTAPITYQWYYNTSNSTSGGTAVSGATGTTLTINSTTKGMNGRYYYCSMKNGAGTTYSPTALLTVWYPFTLGTQPANVNLKKNETGTFSVSIGTAGNPNSYTYQWYRAGTSGGTGSKISGATSSSYKVKPTQNINQEYYYCVVSNGKYSVTSNRGKLVADITSPDITMNSFNQNIIINSTDTLKIPFSVTDSGQGYSENNSNFTSSDIVVKVGGVTITNVSKVLTYKGVSGSKYNYELTLSNITGNGKLSVEVPADAIKDNFNNGNLLETFTTNVTVDNIAPVISLESIVSGVNERYANIEDEVVVKLAVTEAIGMNTSEFTIEDINVKVGETVVTSIINKQLTYTEKVENKYIYTLRLKGLPGEGELSINIGAGKIKDLAKNPNVYTNIPIKNSSGQSVIIDNTKPEIQSLITSLGGYNSSRKYPDSLDTCYDGWANENIYVQINATDNQVIDYYMRSVNNNTNYTKITSYQNIISESMNGDIYYKVVDKAGNSTEINKEIKLDKIKPNIPEMSLYEQRIYGATYIFDATQPCSKSVYVIPNPASIIDKTSVQSGVEEDIKYTYYTITSYKDITKTETKGEVLKFAWNEGFLIKESGYYEISMKLSDIAGNVEDSKIYSVYINKEAENTIKISNINDIGSGINKVTIRIFKSDEAGNKTSKEAITPIVINNPYKEIIKNVRLGDGKFFVEVTLEDNVGLTKVLKKTIVNKL